MDNTTPGSQLREEIHAAITRSGLESELTVYQAIGALRIVEHDLLKMLDNQAKDHERT